MLSMCQRLIYSKPNNHKMYDLETELGEEEVDTSLNAVGLVHVPVFIFSEGY